MHVTNSQLLADTVISYKVFGFESSTTFTLRTLFLRIQPWTGNIFLRISSVPAAYPSPEVIILCLWL